MNPHFDAAHQLFDPAWAPGDDPTDCQPGPLTEDIGRVGRWCVHGQCRTGFG
jgi:hypothetical protein